MRKKLIIYILTIILTVIILGFGCGYALADSNLKIHFIDVGQADSILVQLPNGQNMLVDAGNNDDGQTVVAYINKQGIKRL